MGESVHFITALPAGDRPEPEPEPSPHADGDPHPLPHHLLSGAVAWEISERPLTVGSAPPADARPVLAAMEAAARGVPVCGYAEPALVETGETIRELEPTAEARRKITVRSPARGFVVEVMNESLEGMSVRPGMDLYRIADLSRVWVHADIFESDIPWMRPGLGATISVAGPTARITMPSGISRISSRITVIPG